MARLPAEVLEESQAAETESKKKSREQEPERKTSEEHRKVEKERMLKEAGREGEKCSRKRETQIILAVNQNRKEPEMFPAKPPLL